MSATDNRFLAPGHQTPKSRLGRKPPRNTPGHPPILRGARLHLARPNRHQAPLSPVSRLSIRVNAVDHSTDRAAHSCSVRAPPGSRDLPQEPVPGGPTLSQTRNRNTPEHPLPARCACHLRRVTTVTDPRLLHRAPTRHPSRRTNSPPMQPHPPHGSPRHWPTVPRGTTPFPLSRAPPA